MQQLVDKTTTKLPPIDCQVNEALNLLTRAEADFLSSIIVLVGDVRALSWVGNVRKVTMSSVKFKTSLDEVWDGYENKLVVLGAPAPPLSVMHHVVLCVCLCCAYAGPVLRAVAVRLLCLLPAVSSPPSPSPWALSSPGFFAPLLSQHACVRPSAFC